MSSGDSLPIQVGGALSTELDDLLRGAREYQLAALSPNTLRAYRVNWPEFVLFCHRYGLSPLPAVIETVERYLKWCADMRHHEQRHDDRYTKAHFDGDICPKPKPLKLSSIEQRLATIATVHNLNDLPSPTQSKRIENTLNGIWNAYRTTRGGAPMDSLEDHDVRAIVTGLGTSRIDIRDRAILLLTFLGGMRRSEVAAMCFVDVKVEPKGLAYTLRRSKTNAHGRRGPQRKLIRRQGNVELCAVRWYEEWLHVRGHSDEPFVFLSLVHDIVGGPMSGDDVYDIVKRRVLDRLCAWLDMNARDDDDVAKLRRRKGRITRAQFEDGRLLDHVLTKFKLPRAYDPRYYGAHGLRSGFVTSTRGKKPDFAIQQTTHHASSVMLDRYTHSQDLWRDNASEGIFDA